MPIAGSTSNWVRIRVVPFRMQSTSVRSALSRTSSTVKLGFIAATCRIGLISRPTSGGQRSMIRDLSRWICVSIRPAQPRRPPASWASAAPVSPSSIATILPPATPTSTGSADGRSARRTFRTIRSMLSEDDPHKLQPAASRVDFYQLAMRPFYSVLGRQALGGFRVHVDDNVFRDRLRRGAVRWAGVTGEAATKHGGAVGQHDRVVVPQRVIHPHLGRADRKAFLRGVPGVVDLLRVDPA